MISECWMPARLVAEHYAVSEATLLRYGKRGMIGVRWDDTSGSWAYDALRLRELFLLRTEAAQSTPRESYGTLGDAHLAGGQTFRKAPVTKSAGTLRESTPPRSVRQAS